MALVPISPRQKWPYGFCTRMPPLRSPCHRTQARMTGMAKNDRKNTICPGGTSDDAALIIDDMMMKIVTDPILNKIPRTGCMVCVLCYGCLRSIAGAFEMKQNNLCGMPVGRALRWWGEIDRVAGNK